MSIVKSFAVVCDLCNVRHDWSMECVANTRGITKGKTDVRKEVKELEWTRRQIRSKVWVDVCPQCHNKPTPDEIWFESNAR